MKKAELIEFVARDVLKTLDAIIAKVNDGNQRLSLKDIQALNTHRAHLCAVLAMENNDDNHLDHG